MKSRKMLKKTPLILLGSLLTISLATGASFAQQNKLVVQDAAGTTDVFTVDDQGTVVGQKLGMGTSTPQAPLHLNLPDANGTLPDPGTALFSAATGSAMSTQNNSLGFDMVVAENMGVAGYRGVLRGIRARGTLANPTAAGENDLIFTLDGAVYDGTSFKNSGEIGFYVDGPVSTGVRPVRISFRTRTGGSGPFVERLTVKNDGKIGINEPNPTSILHVTGLPVYSNNSQAISAGLTAGAFYRTSTGALMVVY